MKDQAIANYFELMENLEYAKTDRKFTREGMNEMRINYFIDTNIFVYTFSETAKMKKSVSKELISKSLPSENAIIAHK